MQGIADVAGQNDGCDYELIDISNPNLLLVKSDPENIVLEACKDLTRVQQLLVMAIHCIVLRTMTILLTLL